MLLLMIRLDAVVNVEKFGLYVDDPSMSFVSSLAALLKLFGSTTSTLLIRLGFATHIASTLHLCMRLNNPS